MNDLLHQYFRIAFLMGKPQDLPPGQAQLKIGIALSLLTYVLALLPDYSVSRSLLQAILDVCLSGVAFFVGLQIVNKLPRFEQAFGGLCGAGAVLNAAAIPLFLLKPEVNTAVDASTTVSQTGNSFWIFAEFLILVWSLSLLGHVIRHTFEVSMMLSIAMAMTYVMILVSIFSIFFS